MDVGLVRFNPKTFEGVVREMHRSANCHTEAWIRHIVFCVVESAGCQGYPLGSISILDTVECCSWGPEVELRDKIPSVFTKCLFH